MSINSVFTPQLRLLVNDAPPAPQPLGIKPKESLSPASFGSCFVLCSRFLGIPGQWSLPPLHLQEHLRVCRWLPVSTCRIGLCVGAAAEWGTARAAPWGTLLEQARHTASKCLLHSAGSNIEKLSTLLLRNSHFLKWWQAIIARVGAHYHIYEIVFYAIPHKTMNHNTSSVVWIKQGEIRYCMFFDYAVQNFTLNCSLWY